MAVILETSLGDMTIDLFVDAAPKCCENFLKLCKIKYYNFAPVYNINKGRFLQTGDPIGQGAKDSDGGLSIWGVLSGSSQQKYFKPDFTRKYKHDEPGTVSMATIPSPSDPDTRLASSQFIITIGHDMRERLDKTAAVFGRIVEGFDVLDKINSAIIDQDGRPLRDIRILHTIVLDEADIPDPPGLKEPPSSPLPTAAQLATVRIAHDEVIEEDADPEAMEKLRQEREARAQALTLEMVGDLPFAEVAPPENVLFVCKLNPVTQDEDLDMIFGRFGKILSCEVIRDKKTGDSLQYAFIEFAERQSCEQAYFKMQDVLIDDHRIHVDFSQSVSRLANVWRDGVQTKRRGGFGGIPELEARRQYRDNGESERKRGGRHYEMLFDPQDAKPDLLRKDRPRDRSRDRRRERSPPPDERHHHSHRRRSRSRDRHGDDHRDKHRSHDKHRDRDSHRSHGRDRDSRHGQGRDSDRRRS